MIMTFRTTLVLVAAVAASLGVAVPPATASPADPGLAGAPPTSIFQLGGSPLTGGSNPSCPASYGFLNPANGCESWAAYLTAPLAGAGLQAPGSG
jgi:hypothetical protein